MSEKFSSPNWHLGIVLESQAAIWVLPSLSSASLVLLSCFFLCLLQMVDIQYILNSFHLQKIKFINSLFALILAFALQVIPPGQPSWTDESYQGCFTCRVWQFGHWVEVTIDDRLPCLGGKLCFSQCQTEDLFWLPLLEKAYAKYVNAAVDGNRTTILLYFFCFLILPGCFGHRSERCGCWGSHTGLCWSCSLKCRLVRCASSCIWSKIVLGI